MIDIKITYNDKNELRRVIKESYFNQGNNGKLNTQNNSYIILPKDSVYYKILLGIDYRIKLTNDDLIEGTMRFKKEEDSENRIFLYPESNYCITDDGEKYSFY